MSGQTTVRRRYTDSEAISVRQGGALNKSGTGLTEMYVTGYVGGWMGGGWVFEWADGWTDGRTAEWVERLVFG